MALKYKVISTNKPGKGLQGEKIWFPKLTGSKKIDLLGVARILAKRSTAKEIDVYAVVTGLMDIIPELLMDGYTIKLDLLGSFRLHARVETSDTAEKVTAKKIKEFRIGFTPTKDMKATLQAAKAVKE
jgi:predicted histone-like DNA-binding protein